VAALRATDAAGEEISGAAGGIDQRGVDDPDELGVSDLHEPGVARGYRHGGKHRRLGGGAARLRVDRMKS
jgi:hypothetical protein